MDDQTDAGPAKTAATSVIHRWLGSMGSNATVRANSAIGGKPYQSLSARAYVANLNQNPRWKWTAGFINALFHDPYHCQKSFRRYLSRLPRP
jgi:hypothetical protein